MASIKNRNHHEILSLSTGVGVKLNTNAAVDQRNERRRVILFSKVLSAGSFFPFNIIYS